jgi:hypothetical protein
MATMQVRYGGGWQNARPSDQLKPVSIGSSRSSIVARSSFTATGLVR